MKEGAKSGPPVLAGRPTHPSPFTGTFSAGKDQLRSQIIQYAHRDSSTNYVAGPEHPLFLKRTSGTVVIRPNLLHASAPELKMIL
jgi:hypothetical protein